MLNGELPAGRLPLAVIRLILVHHHQGRLEANHDFARLSSAQLG
jgi:hypothetical protein